MESTHLRFGSFFFGTAEEEKPGNRGGRGTGSEAVQGKDELEQYVSEHPSETNIVFLEVELEGETGIEAGKAVLDHQPDSQIIFCLLYTSRCV